MKQLAIAICTCALVSCATAPLSSNPPAASPLPDSVHWYRDSAELKAIYVETYRAAGRAARELSSGLRAQSWGVVLDVDETILDNSEYEKRIAQAGQQFEPGTWNKWVDERAATLLPGAKSFIDSVRDDLHGQIVLVTNRLQSECAATEENLRKEGIRYDRILCDAVGDGDKNPRFRSVSAGDGTRPGLDVLIFVGDNIQDFPSLSQQSPESLAQFGTRYFVLPNPMYGSWSSVPPR